VYHSVSWRVWDDYTCRWDTDEETLANDYGQATSYEGEDYNLERTDSGDGTQNP